MWQHLKGTWLWKRWEWLLTPMKCKNICLISAYGNTIINYCLRKSGDILKLEQFWYQNLTHLKTLFQKQESGRWSKSNECFDYCKAMQYVHFNWQLLTFANQGNIKLLFFFVLTIGMRHITFAFKGKFL